jgi:hypothetical protein
MRTLTFGTPSLWSAVICLLLAGGCAAGTAKESGGLDPLPATVTAITVEPDSAELGIGESLGFNARAHLSDGSTTGAIVVWTATGGSVTSAGDYTAGSTPGTYHVVAVDTSGLADTSVVRVLPMSPTLTAIQVTPASAALQPGEARQFAAAGLLTDGNTTTVTVSWSATGGTITPAGLYTAGAAMGSFRVIAAQQGGPLADTALVTITRPPATLTAVLLTPPTATLQFRQSQQFSAVGQLSDGSTTPLPVTWTATGGTVSATGRYTAGSTAGTFRVIAAAAGGLADTSAITVTAPTITAIVVTPATASLTGGATKQFTASATLSNGTTQPNPSVTWTGTGGTISTAGLYTAGGTAGNFRVIAASANGKADTSSVTITTQTPTITAVVVTPATASLASGATQPFTASATLSNGTTQPNPSVTWSATGGSISAAGLYTAGGTAGSFRVIAALSPGGSLADTATVTITPAGARTYSTSFPLTENPISEGGRWVNGFTTGIDWSDVATKPGMAYGPQRSGFYNDPTALLTGTWGPDQRVTAVIAGTANSLCGEEVELRLRSTISGHNNRGYEVTFKNSTDPGSTYLIIVRWNGAFGDFTYLFDQRGDPKFFIQPGDVISATIVGNLITAYKNGTVVGQVTDNSFTSGQPGIGFSFDTSSCSGVGAQFGFSSVTATDAP